jgi:hypothetical protein
MRPISRYLAPSAIALTALLASCDSPTRPATEGSIVPRIEFISADPMMWRIEVDYDSVFGTIYRDGVVLGVPHELVPAAPDGWRLEVGGLAPDVYDLELIGYANDSIQRWGRANGITVVAGNPTPAPLVFFPLAPTLAAPSATTNAFSASITFPQAVTGATEYRVEASKSLAFPALGLVVGLSPTTTVLLQLPDTGTWHYRAKAVIPAPGNNVVRFSDPRTFAILAATSGRTPGTANNVALTIGAPGDTIYNRNITLAGPDTIDYFTLPGLRAGDTLTIEAVAGDLTPPSPLNPTLLLLRANGVDTVEFDDNDGPGNDALIKVALPATESYIAVVGRAPGAAAGHYEFRYLVRRNPALPTAFLAAVTAPGNVHLSWTDNAGANDDPDNGYEIYRCAGAGCTPLAPPANPTATPIATTAASATSFDDATVTVGEEYTYRIRARQDAEHFSALTSTSSVSLVIPAVPTGLSATTISATQVNLTWGDAATTESGYEVERCEGVTCTNFAPLVSLGANATSHNDLTATYGIDYRYQVRAVSPQGNSAFTAFVIASTQPPATPTVLTAVTFDSSRITLGWADNASNETGFRMERCDVAACVNFVEIGTTPANVAVYIDSTAVPGTDYRYRVRAYHLITSQTYSNVADADTRPALAPSGLLATVVTAAVELTWTDVADDELLTEVERCVTSSCTYALLTTLNGSGHVGYTDNTAAADVDYSYRVRARNASGFSPYSNVSSVVTTIEAAPSGLSATTISGTQIDLDWVDNSTTENGFYIERCVGGSCTDFAPIVITAAGAEGYSDNTVTIGLVYRYQVRARTAFGLSFESNIATATTLLPAAPSTLVASTLSNVSVGLTWDDLSDNETGFAIDRCEGPTCSNFAQVGTVPADAEDFTDTGLNPGSEYTYRVRATNAVGTSAASNTSSASTNLPAIITSFAAEVSAADAIRLTWSDNSTDELDQRLERCSSGPDCTDFAEVATVGADLEEYTESGLLAGTIYRYRIRARNGAGYSDYSSIVSLSAGVPGSASGLSATTISATQVDLSWVDGSDNEARFIIERCVGIACVDFAPFDTVAPDVAVLVDNTVSLGNEYRYRVTAENGAGPAASPTNVGVAHTFVPDAPTGLAASTFSSTRVDLTWADGGDYETSYELERCLGAGCSNFALILTTGPDVTSYEDAGLTGGLIYRYRIRALNAVGTSAYDGPVDATTDIPVAPSDVFAVAASPTSVSLEWTDNADNETSQIIERCTGAGCGNFAVLNLLADNVTDYVDGTAAYGETYRYRIRAVGTAGPSPFTTPVQVTLLEPTAAADFTVTTTSGTSIALTWTDASDNEQGFRVERCTGAGCSSFTQIAVAAMNASGYPDAAVVLNESYTYRVRAFNLVGDGSNTAELTANTLIPADPAGLTATTIAADRIDLAWSDNASNETGYQIERCTGFGCVDFTPLTTTAADATSYQDLGLALSESYSYRLTAVNVAGTSATIGPVTATTVLPANPTALSALVTSASTIDLGWSDNAANEAGYRIERCSGIGCSSFIEVATVGADATGFTSTGLAMNSFYSHRVRAFNAAGTSAYTATVTSNTFAPGPPSALTGETLTATSVALAWSDNSANESGFRIERCSGVGCSVFAEIATVGVDAEAFVDLTAPAAESNTYRVRSYNGVGNSTFSGTAIFSTVVPTPPSGLVATAQGQAQVQLLWTDNATDETGYRVERCAGPGCSDFTLLTTLAANSTLHNDNTVAAATAYRYRVIAFGNGSSDYSNVGEAATILPAAPTALVATAISDDRIDLTWADNADNETNYRVERCTGALCTDLVQVTVLGADVVSFTDLGVASGNSYRYVVVALNDAGNSPPSDTASAATDIPGLPTGLTATVVTPVQIDLAWTDNATTETGFSIERCTGGGCSDFTEIAVAPADAVSFIDVSVVISTTYLYRIRAVNLSGTSGYTNIATAATNPPSQPTGLSAVVISANQIDLTWTDAANNEAGYQIERCDFFGCSLFANIGNLGPDAVAFSDLTTTVGNFYAYRVRAVNAAGDSPYSDEFYATTFVPADPTSLVATTISATRIDLTWADNADNESAVRVERCEGLGCSSFALVTTLPAGSTAFTNDGLTAGLLYRYQIVMTNAAGSSGPSNEAQASTDFPLPPSDLTATTLGDTKIELTWSDNSGNEDNFEIERCDGDGCSSFAPLTTVGADVTTFTDETVSLGNFYTYRVRAINFAGASDFTSPAAANTNPPAQPTLSSAIAQDPTTVRVTWVLQGATTGYFVQRCEAAACSFSTVADVGSGVSQVDDLVTTGITYRYQVIAYNAAGQSVPSSQIDVAMAVPAVASGVGGIALSATQVQLSWTDNASDETQQFVQRCSGAGCGAFSTIATLGPNETSFQDDGLAPAGVFNYRVIAANAVGSAAPSAAAEVSLNAPQAPTALAATTAAPGQINLTWLDNSDRELQYAVERCTGGLCIDFVQVATLGINATGFPNTGLDLNAVYRFRVRALNNVGPSAYTAIATANTLLPAAASGLTATTIHGQRVDLLWADNSSNESGFRIQRCTGVSCVDFAQIATVGANVTSVQDLSAVYGVTYNYRILASNVSGDAAPSNTATASTLLAAPGNVVATTLNRTDVQVTWNDIGSFEAAYQVFRCEGPGCSSFAFVGSVGGAVNTFTNSGLNPASDYTYQVRAATVGGASVMSAGAGARTPIEVLNGTLLSIPADTFQSRRHWVVNVPPGTAEFRIQFNPVGFEDPDLYVRRGAVATALGFAMSDTLCAPWSGGVETCVFTAPPAGDFFITMHGFSAYSGGTIAFNVQYEFNTCSNAGAFGPSQVQCNAAYANSTLDGDVSVTGGVQSFTVPFAGTYEVVAVGAQGAAADPLYLGGRGAQITGRFALTAGQTIKLAVGQMGSGQGSNFSGGGGGGSFVVDNADNPLLVAGGGGGTRASVSQSGCNASITQFGTIASGSGLTTPCSVKVDALGAGGIVSSGSWGSAGAGFFGNGGHDVGWGFGGLSWGNGLTGGTLQVSSFCAVEYGAGGFGGGGSGHGCHGGGGGGGYSGGDGGRVAGGGGSYNSGTSPSAGISPIGGHGRIRLRWVGP